MNYKSVLIVVLLSCFAASVVAQAAALRGSVSDKSGLAMPGVTVTVTDEKNSMKYSGISNEAGMFRVPDVVPGQYSIQTEMPGFKTTKISNVIVKAGKDTTVKITIAIGRD